MPDLRTLTVSRRAMLAGAGVLAAGLAGCTTAAPRPEPEAPADPLEALLEAQTALVSAYDAAIMLLPAEARLAGLRTNAAEHAKAIAGALAAVLPSSSSAAGSSAVPDPASVLADLASRESVLATQCRQLAISEPAKRAPLLASMSAAHSAAAAVLA